ncbi:MAG: tRNA-guanine transglycosylase, partial [Anaerolineales bacterium]|nr:tRNA-guanine transglycosylase [Anaerolineales bacterium]
AMTPELSMQIQRTLGSDIVMCFDDVIGLPAERAEVEEAMERSLRWAKRCKDEFERTKEGSRNPDAQLFGIIQGGTDIELRKRSVEGMLKIGCNGYAIGGLSVGEPFEDAIKVIDEILPMLPQDKPRYFMGGAQPDQIVEYVKRGIDMFDCVLPTRNARHGHVYRWGEGAGSRESGVGKYEVVNVTNAKWRGSKEPIAKLGAQHMAHGSGGRFEEELSRYSMGYLHHLFDTKEMLAYRLATIANLMFYLDLFSRIRQKH